MSTRSAPSSRLSQLALLGSAVLLAISAVATPAIPDAAPDSDLAASRALIEAVAAERGQFYIAFVFGVFGAGLLLAGMPALVAAARGRGGRLAAVGGVLAVLGVLGFVGLQGAGSGTLYQLSSGAIDVSGAGQIWASEANRSQLGFGVFALPFFLFMPLGFVLLGIALFRSGAVPKWQGVLLAVGVVLALFGAVGVLARVTPLPFCLALGALALGTLRTELNPQPEPPGADVAGAGAFGAGGRG